MGSELDRKVVGSNLVHPILDRNDVKVMPGSIPRTPNPDSYSKEKEINTAKWGTPKKTHLKKLTSILMSRYSWTSIVIKIKFILGPGTSDRHETLESLYAWLLHGRSSLQESQVLIKIKIVFTYSQT